MKINILSQWYPPETETRIHILAKHLASKGNSVISITGFPNYPKGKIFPGYKIKWRKWEKMDNVKVLRLPLYPSHDNFPINRILNYLSFAFSASSLGLILVRRADVMWVYHPPLTIGLPALIISKIRRIPFIYEIQDMWPETLLATGMIRNKRVLRILDLFSKLVYSYASAIVVISQGFKLNLVKKGVKESKIHIIPNWADENIYREFENKKYGNSKFKLVYAGNIGKAQALNNLVDASELLISENTLIYIIGDGLEKDTIKSKISEKKIDNIILLDKMPPLNVIRFYEISDALLIHLKKDELFSITIPGKTFAYMACGRPIICAADGEVAKVIEEAKCGIVVPPEDPKKLAEAIEKMANMSIYERIEMGKNGAESYRNKYSQEVSMTKYDSLFNSLNNRKNRTYE